MSLVSELRRRNVLRMAAAYLAGSWLLLQIVETLLPVFELDEGSLRYFVIALGIGFIPTLAVSWAFEWTPDGLRREQDTSSKTPAAMALAKTWDRVILVVMALALSVFAFDRFVLSPEREAALVASATEAGAEMERARATDVAHESVAVLPFTNMSADPDNEYFSDGLTETLLHMLAQVSDLQVAARTSSFAFKGRNTDIRVIAAQLGVAHVLEGSVQKAADRIRVTAQLIRAEDGFHLWSQNYDRTLDDIFRIQDEIAADVADALGSTILASSENTVIGIFTDDVNAYDIYLQALEQQAIGTFDALSVAENLLQEALVADPYFVDTKLALVRNSFMKFYTGAGDFDVDSVVSARLLGEVLAENPGDLSARQFDLRLRGVIAARAMDLVEFRALMEQILLSFQSGYGDPFVRADVVSYLISESRTDEALKLLQEALVLDPLNVSLLMAQAQLLWTIDGTDAAEQPLRTALSVQPDNPMLLWGLAGLETNRGNLVEGMRLYRRTELVDSLDPAATQELALLFTELGLHDYAARWMDEYRSRETVRHTLISVEVQTAAERNDEETLQRIVPAAMDELFADESVEQLPESLLNEYAVLMLREGRAQEGLDYLESTIPGISDLSGDPAYGWREMNIQSFTVIPFLNSLGDDETPRQNTITFTGFLEERGIVIGEDDPSFVRIQLSLHGLEAAKTAFLSIYPDKVYILSGLWHLFKRAPWAAELRADPEVASAMADREDKLAVFREQVLEMLQEPEWQEGFQLQ